MALFVPLDVNFYEDAKVIQVGVHAELLYVRGLALAKRLRTDGVVLQAHFDLISRGLHHRYVAARRLVEVGLWEEIDDGWFICGWFNHNPRDSEISEARRDAGLLGNHRRWHLGKQGTPSADCKFCIANGSH